MPGPAAASPARTGVDRRLLRLVLGARRSALDPIDRFSKIIFGLIMVLTFTGTFRVAEGGREDVRELLVAALACNVAWGVVDGVMYVVTCVVDRARRLAVLEGIRGAGPAEARRIVLAALPEGIAAVADDAVADHLVERVRALPALPLRRGLHVEDLRGALLACVLVVAATLPPTLPFLVVRDLHVALHASNAVAVASLFVAGFQLGRSTGTRPWPMGFAMVLVGAALVGLTIALGG